MGEIREIYDNVRKLIKVENPITIMCTGEDVCKFLHHLVTACHILFTGKQLKHLCDGKSPDGRLND